MEVLGVANRQALLRLLRRFKIPYIRLMGVPLYPRLKIEELGRRLRMKERRRNPGNLQRLFVVVSYDYEPGMAEYFRKLSPRRLLHEDFRVIRATEEPVTRWRADRWQIYDEILLQLEVEVPVGVADKLLYREYEDGYDAWEEIRESGGRIIRVVWVVEY
jgi:hypothetical protein